MLSNLVVKLYHSGGEFVIEELAYKTADAGWGLDIEIEMPTTKFDSDGWKDDVYHSLCLSLGRINTISYVTKLNP